jgi:gliding motility-associated lipoprotein GldD
MCITPPEENLDNALWRNIVYPRYNATIYLSYLPIDNNLDQLMAESIELVYRQNVNTDKVEAIEYESNEEQLYATLFTLSAESATPIQFIATDRSQYLLRGALYYDSTVKSDSVAPTLHYLREDIMHLIESITPATH